MARILTPQDAHVIMNELVKQATGQSALAAVDTSNFVSAGETVLATGMENTLNSLSLVLGRTFAAVRPYDAKFRIVNAINTGEYAHRIRKISYYSRPAQPAGDWNTQLYTNFAPGFTNGQNADAEGKAQSVKSMWEQNPPVVMEKNFGGSSVWDVTQTIYEYQLKPAFRSDDAFAEFVSGIMTERANDIESQKEAFSRMLVLNHIAATLDNGAVESMVNLTKAFNTRYGTSYTSAQLLGDHYTEFMKFFVATVQTYSDRMTNRDTLYHIAPSKSGYELLRHTPKDRQRLMLYNPFINEARAMVMSGIFNPGYLDVNNYEGVDYWQSVETPAAINVTPAIMNTNTGIQVAGNNVTQNYIVGVLYDVDAMMIDFQLDSSGVSPLEVRKMYRNMVWHFSRNAISDQTEKTIVFYMEDE